MPGVGALELGDQEIIIRGMESHSTQVFVDGLPVMQPYHGLGISSVVSTEVLSRLDFYPGNYSVKDGRGLGGIIDIDCNVLRSSQLSYGCEGGRCLPLLERCEEEIVLAGPHGPPPVPRELLRCPTYELEATTLKRGCRPAT